MPDAKTNVSICQNSDCCLQGAEAADWGACLTAAVAAIHWHSLVREPPAGAWGTRGASAEAWKKQCSKLLAGKKSFVLGSRPFQHLGASWQLTELKLT